ncbi:MAG: AAA family ATPase [Spirochaetales bacterium]|nr:AAA family ATPase [Spirochaetales bacterium]MDY5914879.1 AAA family ATPase [Treponema sp.]
MFLKSLDIHGFKSFADKTHIDFAEGITALVGPNGCGKSNVVDAIKWVLAERNSKNLRAEKMEDVIFNGTERRPALNTAEVTLTIANDKGLLPLDEEEIAITRRLYRSGDAEYFINKRPAGPTEIRKLFLDTGVGKAAYSVMEQGKIDQILSSKPEDRRYLFEEAAGISRSKTECAEAERELEKTRQNMVQIEIAMNEIKRQYDTLKVQSEKTIKYRKYKEEIYETERDLALLRLKSFVQDKAHHEEDLKRILEKRDKIRQEIEEINNTISENMDKVKEMQDNLYNKQASLLAIGQEKNGKMELIKQQNQQAMILKEKINSLEGRRNSIQERIDNIQEEIDEQNANLHTKTKQLNDIKSNIQSFEDNITTSSSQITENDKQVDSFKNQIQKLEEKRLDLQSTLAQITEDIVKTLDEKLKDAGFSENALKKAKDELETKINKLKIFVEGRKNIFGDMISQNLASQDYKDAVCQAEKAFEDAFNQLNEIQLAISEYQNASPAFITEFLSPQGIMTKKRDIDEQINQNIQSVESINSQISHLHGENKTLLSKIEEYKETLNKLKLNEIQMKEQISASQSQINMLNRQISSEKASLEETENELFIETKRADEISDQINTYQDELAEIEYRGKKLAEEMNALDSEIAKANKNVSGKSDSLNKKREEQNRCQEQYERLTISINSSDNDIRNVKQNFQEQYSRDLMEFEERMYKITVPAADLREKLSQTKKDFQSLGTVNLMAPEEFGEVKERYERQRTNFEDTQKSLENLIRVSEEIKSKSAEMFLETYNQIKKNFHNMFRRLFNGGRAELKLADPTNILTSGIDIYAQPPGKKLENIALLSGGEKTMTAVALLFATYQVRPSPFCLLDEIDAALDDKNVSSFVTALESFASVSQYIVITHNKKTVMGASTMLGITMEESGVSKMIALRLDEDIKRGAEIDRSQDDFVEEEVPEEEGIVVPQRPPKRQ